MDAFQLGASWDKALREKSPCWNNNDVLALRTRPNFIELLKAQKVAKHNKIVLTRIRLPAKLPCHRYISWVVSCSFLLSRKLLGNFFCFSSFIKFSSGLSVTFVLNLSYLQIFLRLLLLISVEQLKCSKRSIMPSQNLSKYNRTNKCFTIVCLLLNTFLGWFGSSPSTSRPLVWIWITPVD